MDCYRMSLAFGMLVTGTVNTITAKLADQTNATGLHGETREFDHPYAQTFAMFVGELLCLLVFYFMRFVYNRPPKDQLSNFPRYVFALPAAFDVCSSSLMNLGLTMTYASVFQMLRGTLVIFTGILSVTVLRRKLRKFHWFSMSLVLLGAGIVGFASVMHPSSSNSTETSSRQLWGIIFILLAQVIVSVQMIVEEKLLEKYRALPIEVVGWEGFWGCCILSCLLVIMYFIPGDRQGSFENALDAWQMVKNSWVLTAAIVGYVFSIAFFNFFGVSVTQSMSATHRTVLDSMRTLLVWVFSLVVQWQSFLWMQAVGFVILLAGIAGYNEVLRFYGFNYPSKEMDYEPLSAADTGTRQAAVLPESDPARQ